MEFAGLMTADRVFSTILVGLLVWISVSDWRSYRIPNAANALLLGVGLLCSFGWPWTTMTDAALGVVFGYVVLAGLGWIHFHKTKQEGLGLGDAKLLAASGAWVGWQYLPILVAVSATSALAFCVLTKKRKLAFGPWLAFSLLWIWVDLIRGDSSVAMR